MTMGIMLGNLMPEDIEKRTGITFTDEFKRLLMATHNPDELISTCKECRKNVRRAARYFSDYYERPAAWSEKRADDAEIAYKFFVGE